MFYKLLSKNWIKSKIREDEEEVIKTRDAALQNDKSWDRVATLVDFFYMYSPSLLGVIFLCLYLHLY